MDEYYLFSCRLRFFVPKTMGERSEQREQSD